MSDFLENEDVEALFNAYQYLSLMLMRNITDIHSALPNGDIESSRTKLQEMRAIMNSMDKAVDAIDDLLSTEDSGETEEEIEDFLDEDFEDDDEDVSEPVSLDEIADKE